MDCVELDCMDCMNGLYGTERHGLYGTDDGWIVWIVWVDCMELIGMECGSPILTSS